MRLIDDVKRVAPRLWSIRLALLSAVLSAIEVALPYMAPAAPSGKFAALSALVALASAVARIVSQPKLWGSKDVGIGT